MFGHGRCDAEITRLWKLVEELREQVAEQGSIIATLADPLAKARVVAADRAKTPPTETREPRGGAPNRAIVSHSILRNSRTHAQHAPPDRDITRPAAVQPSEHASGVEESFRRERSAQG